MPPKRVRSTVTTGSTAKKQQKHFPSDYALANFIDDEAEEANEFVEAGEDDEGNESDHSTFSMLERAQREREAAATTEVDVPVEPADVIEPAVTVDESTEDVAPGVEPDVNLPEAVLPAPVANQNLPVVAEPSKVPDSDKSVNPPKTIKWVEGRPRLNQRIDKIMAYSNDHELTYSITNVPADARIFSSDDTVRDRVHMLGRPLMNRPSTLAPITIWIVGRLTRVFLRDNNGGLPKSVSVNIRPLDPRALHAASTLLRRHTTDTSAVDRYDDVRVSRWMTVKPPREISERIDGFDAIWDAKKTLVSPRDKMLPLFATDVKKGDLALVEANLARYRVVDKGAAKDATSKSKKKADNWAAYFALKSICVLDDTPLAADPDAEAPVRNWEL
ncbi:hypothetical protein AURDEDRAFT_177090 [Auricularia subglabra TFB-10046 SS5]|uniref:Uncharacterized protein n=1 Tax=Auricularia subglabra (strain TFB-10046 / SS5) TaxID=717982 RepID=J0WN98_AURST|nr:hypothetical protein AURDEDRAFT_177090 [Auricularia subglabra TFB-10046 SS5]